MITLRNTKLVVTALLAFFLMSSVFIGTSWNSTNITNAQLYEGRHSLSSASSIIIDGTISTDEWSTAQHKVQWYMDADPENSDGYNYMYLDEDPYNLYIALDLCSDQTNDESGEWVGLWLNTNETSIYDFEFNPPIEWEAALDKGMESLLHDVENDKTIEFFTNSEIGADNVRPSEWIVVNGTIEGSQSEIFSDDEIYLNMTSEFNGTHHVYRLDLDIDFYDSFPIFEDMYVEQVQRVRFWYRSEHNISINEHFMSVSDNLGDLNPDINFTMGTGTSEVFNYVEIFRENFTSGSNLRFSMNGVNDLPFNTSFDFMQYDIYVNQTTSIGGSSLYPYTSISNYDIAWSYGPTENNASDHRSFEIKIPKSELEGYEMDTPLGIIVGGYGTLSSWPGTHNWVFANSKLTGIPEEDSSQYNNYTMPMKGWTPPSAPVLNAISPDPDPDGNVLVTWNDNAAVENWTVYRHSSEITELNLALATVIASGLTTDQYNDTGLSDGTYWYAVAATGPFGYSYLSSSLSVTVEFPATTPTTTTTPPPSPIDQQLILILGGAGAAILLVIVIIIARKR